MKEDMNKFKGRRDFLKDGMRAVLLAGFAFTGFSLGMRSQTDSLNGSSCQIDLPCRSCAKFRRCRQPEAQSVKNEKTAPRYSTGMKEKGVRGDR
jgi:hypothetical protein